MAGKLDGGMLPAIEDVHIDVDLPLKDRHRSVLEQMDGNPYDFMCCKTRVHISFANECTLEDAVGHYLAMRNNGALPEPSGHPAV